MKIVSYLKKLNKGILPLIFIFIIVYAFSLPGCKGFGTPDWELEVTVGEGIAGTPDQGKYTYQELETIDYNYYPVDDRYTAEIYVNGGSWSLAGQFVMYTNLKVQVNLFDIRGTWTFFYEITDSEEDEKQIEITFTGDDLLTGSFTDSRGYSGTWEISDSVLTLSFADWQDYEFIGSVPSMSGTWTGAALEGTWSATR